MSIKSIYHLQKLNGARVIRLNLRAVRDLLPEDGIENFDLSEAQRSQLQRRLDLYVKFGGRLDLQCGTQDQPERMSYSRVQKARPERMVRGVLRKATPKQIIPGRLIPAQKGIEPSIDHLPTKEALAMAVRIKR
jgi:hypothetical protein